MVHRSALVPFESLSLHLKGRIPNPIHLNSSRGPDLDPYSLKPEGFGFEPSKFGPRLYEFLMIQAWTRNL